MFSLQLHHHHSTSWTCSCILSCFLFNFIIITPLLGHVLVSCHVFSSTLSSSLHFLDMFLYLVMFSLQFHHHHSTSWTCSCILSCFLFNFIIITPLLGHVLVSCHVFSSISSSSLHFLDMFLYLVMFSL